MLSKIACRVGLATVAANLVLPFLPSAVVGAQRPVAPFSITALKAMLFFGQTGTFSADLLGPSAPKLQNVATGEGQSTATLVLVEITGQPDSYAPSRKITLTATAQGRVLISRTVALGRPGNDRKFYAGFWIYDTGCVPVVLDARLIGQSPNATLRKTLNFKCGD
ncbi:MAG TPA: hypothetical protein VF443_05635 [Nitrospira sp.]